MHSETLPTLDSKNQEIAPGLIADYTKLQQATREFLINTDKGQPLLPAIINLLHVLNKVNKPAVDHLVHSIMTPATHQQGGGGSVQPPPRPDSFWEETVKKYNIKKETHKLEAMPLVEGVY